MKKPLVKQGWQSIYYLHIRSLCNCEELFTVIFLFIIYLLWLDTGWAIKSENPLSGFWYHVLMVSMFCSFPSESQTASILESVVCLPIIRSKFSVCLFSLEQKKNMNSDTFSMLCFFFIFYTRLLNSLSFIYSETESRMHFNPVI